MNLQPDQIVRVKYFNINYDHPDFFYRSHHRTDLGIEIEFKSGKFLHLGWSENDRPEYSIGAYNRSDDFADVDTFSSIDATKEWYLMVRKDIRSIEVDYVNESMKIPAKCVITTEDENRATIVVSEAGPAENELPLTMEHTELSEFFVFFNSDPPPIIPVTIEIPDYEKSIDSKAAIPAMDIFNKRSFGLLLVILVVGASILYYILSNMD